MIKNLLKQYEAIEQIDTIENELNSIEEEPKFKEEISNFAIDTHDYEHGLEVQIQVKNYEQDLDYNDPDATGKAEEIWSVDGSPVIKFLHDHSIDGPMHTHNFEILDKSKLYDLISALAGDELTPIE